MGYVFLCFAHVNLRPGDHRRLVSKLGTNEAARDGFFSSSRPSGNERDRPRRRRPFLQNQSAMQNSTSSLADDASSSPHSLAEVRYQQRPRQTESDEEARAETAKRKAELEEGFLATSSTGRSSSRGDERRQEDKRSLEDVVVEKSNVLMM